MIPIPIMIDADIATTQAAAAAVITAAVVVVARKDASASARVATTALATAEIWGPGMVVVEVVRGVGGVRGAIITIIIMAAAATRRERVGGRVEGVKMTLLPTLILVALVLRTLPLPTLTMVATMAP